MIRGHVSKQGSRLLRWALCEAIQHQPAAVEAENPAFDVTPNRYIAAVITERGIATAPYPASLQKLGEQNASELQPAIASR